jgi:hypothetical protein
VSTCEFYVNWGGKPPLCGAPAAAVVRTACVHEHYGEAIICARCEARIRAYLAEHDAACFICLECEEGRDPHRCVRAVEYAPLAGAR